MIGNEFLQFMNQAKALGKFGFGPYGSAVSTLAGAPEAFSVRDKKAYPMRLSDKDRKATIHDAMEARYSSQPPEPDWMKSWSGMGAAAKDLGGRMNYDPNKAFPFTVGEGQMPPPNPGESPAQWRQRVGLPPLNSNGVGGSVHQPPGPPMAPPGPPGPPPQAMGVAPGSPGGGPAATGQGPWWMQAANGMSPGVSQGLRGPPPAPPQPPQAPPGPPMSLSPPNPGAGTAFPGPMAQPSSSGLGFNFFGPMGKGLDTSVNDSAALVKKFYQDTFGQ